MCRARADHMRKSPAPHRIGSATEHFRVYTVRHTVVRDVIWAWACGDPSWTVAVQWRQVAGSCTPLDLAIDPSELRGLASSHTAQALPIAEVEAAETVEAPDDPDGEA